MEPELISSMNLKPASAKDFEATCDHLEFRGISDKGRTEMGLPDEQDNFSTCLHVSLVPHCQMPIYLLKYHVDMIP